jgi:hypothetical protein
VITTGRFSARRLGAFGLAGANLVLISLLLVIPGLAGAPQADTVLLSVLVVSVQAGQAVVVQVGSAFPNKWYSTTAFALVLLLVIALGRGFAGEQMNLLISIGLAIAGVLFGTFVGSVAQQRLVTGSAFSYQFVLLSRSLVWAVVLSLCLLLTPVDVLLGTFLAWSFIVILSSRSSKITTSTMGITGTIAIGAMAGLLYRNDVSLARSASLGPMFHEWNITLILYTISQALLGFVVVNEIFSRRSAVLERFTEKKAALLRLVVVIILPSFTLASFVLERASVNGFPYFVLQAVLLIGAGSLVAIQATLAHVTQVSWLVYVGGALGFGALALAYAGGAAPAAGLLIELLVSGIVVASGSFIFRRHRQANAQSSNSSQESGI